MAQTLTQIEMILKDKYQPALKNQLGIEPSPFLEKIRKTPLTNNTIKVASPIGINGGFGFGAEGVGTPKSGAQRYAEFQLDAVDMYVDIQISNKTVKLGSTNRGAMINALDQEVKGSYASAKWNIGRSLFGDGTGKLTTVSALGTAGNTVTVADTSKLVEGLTVDFYAAGAAVGSTPALAGRRITAINRAGKTITVDGSAATVSAGFITVQNSYGRELCGLGAIYDDSVTTLYGLTKSDNLWMKPTVISAANELSDLVLYRGVKEAKDYKSADIDLIMMGDNAFAAYQDYMRTNNVVVADRMHFKGGAVGYTVLVGSQEVTVVNERFVPANEAWGVDTRAFTLEATEWDFMSKDGAVFVPMANTSIFRALLASYGNLVCTNPGGCIRFTNCEISA